MSIRETEQEVITTELLNAFRSGDMDAYKTLYLTYKTSIQDFIATLVRSEEDAEDITQEIFVNIWKNKELLDASKGIKGYIFIVAKNAALKFLNKKKLSATFTESEGYNVEYGVKADDMIIAKETAILMAQVVEKMPKQRKEVFELSRKEGLNNSEIATRLNISKENVAVHLHYAMKDLKKMIYMFLLLSI